MKPTIGRHYLLVLLLSALVAAPAAAQNVMAQTFTYDVLQQAPDTAVFVGRSAEVGLIAVEPFETGRPATGAPYTAEAITETTQVLADGNRIEHRSSVTIYRDSEGRVRREQQSMALGPLVARAGAPMITITDPTTGVHVTLDPEQKTAFRSKAPLFDIAVPPDRFAVAGSASAAIGMAGDALRLRTDKGSALRIEQLGKREIEGVQAEGTRTTMTIPAGAIGNQLPIEVVSERWYSPDLQVVVLTRRSDPRFGETVYRLANIVRAEPAADLFQIPPDYKVKAPTMGTFLRKR